MSKYPRTKGDGFPRIRGERFVWFSRFGTHWILWMYLHLPDSFNRKITRRLHKVHEFIAMKDITDEVVFRANQESEWAVDEGWFV